MTSYVLALMIALQVGQDCPSGWWYQTDPPMCQPEGSGTTGRQLHRWANSFDTIALHPRPQDLMPLVVPLPPDQTFSDTIHVKGVRLMPSVVPAIQEKRLTHHKGDTCPAFGATYCSYANDQYELRWTCKDKTNVLQVSEDGSGHWCVRF